MNLQVDIDSRCDHSEWSDEQWGPWEESWSHYFEGVRISEHGEPVDFDVKPGDTVYVVWAIYSTGDSFGYATCGSTQVVGIFKSREKAEKCHRLAKECESYSLQYESESGKMIPVHPGWIGYFESLEFMHLDSAVVRE